MKSCSIISTMHSISSELGLLYFQMKPYIISNHITWMFPELGVPPVIIQEKDQSDSQTLLKAMVWGIPHFKGPSYGPVWGFTAHGQTLPWIISDPMHSVMSQDGQSEITVNHHCFMKYRHSTDGLEFFFPPNYITVTRAKEGLTMDTLYVGLNVTCSK